MCVVYSLYTLYIYNGQEQQHSTVYRNMDAKALAAAGTIKQKRNFIVLYSPHI
jgi:hypothetical protein